MPQPKRLDLSGVRRTHGAATLPWKGPTVDGITQSMLGGYLAAPHRFWVRSILGYQPPDRFFAPIAYGDYWHECEAEHAANPGADDVTYKPAERLCRQYVAQYPLQAKEAVHWFRVCQVQFPLYVAYWKENDPDGEGIRPLMQEYSFNVEYDLPSGRMVRMRGKFDQVDRVKRAGVFLKENKSKSMVDRVAIERQVNYDLQSMYYLNALRCMGLSPRGVRYNVVRRPLSGGKGSIKRRSKTKNKPEETHAEYYGRLQGILGTCQEEYFDRWSVKVSSKALDRFLRETLHPMLENLLDDYEWWEATAGDPESVFDYTKRSKEFPHHLRRHFRLPYGTYYRVGAGGTDDVDAFLANGSTAGLVRVKSVFPEL